MTKTRQIPVGACLFQLQDVGVESMQPLIEGGPETRKFKGNAHTGEPFSDWWYGKAIVDLASLRIDRQDVPVLKDHNREIGFTDSIKVTDGGLEVEGVLLGVTELGRETIAFLDAGMPWQMSVYVPPERIQVLDEGEEAEVNGQLRQGPLAIWRDCAMREATVTALGRDGNTSVSLLGERRGETLTVQLQQEEDTMTTKNEGSGTPAPAPLTPALLKEQQPDVYEAVLELGRKEGHKLGIDTERARINTLRERGEGIDAELVQKAIDDGTSVADATAAFLSYVKASKEGQLTALREQHKDGVGVDDTEAALAADHNEKSPDTKAAKAAFLKLPEGEEKWKQGFETHGDAELGMTAEQLQDQYCDVEFYLADKRHLAKAR